MIDDEFGRRSKANTQLYRTTGVPPRVLHLSSLIRRPQPPFVMRTRSRGLLSPSLNRAPTTFGMPFDL